MRILDLYFFQWVLFVLAALALTPVGCSTPTKKSPNKKVVIFVVGVEGSYHHYLYKVFEGVNVGQLCAFNSWLIQYRANWTDLYMDWAQSNNKGTRFVCKYLKTRGNLIIHAVDSFPGGRPVTANSFPYLRGFLHLNATGRIDLRLLYLNRDILDATISALNRFNGGTHTLGKCLVTSMGIFKDTLMKVPHFVFSDSDDDVTRLANLQGLYTGIADPNVVEKALRAQLFLPHKHIDASEMEMRSELESIVGPHMKHWAAELTRGTVFINKTKDSRLSDYRLL